MSVNSEKIILRMYICYWPLAHWDSSKPWPIVHGWGQGAVDFDKMSRAAFSSLLFYPPFTRLPFKKKTPHVGSAAAATSAEASGDGMPDSRRVHGRQQIDQVCHGEGAKPLCSRVRNVWHLQQMHFLFPVRIREVCVHFARIPSSTRAPSGASSSFCDLDPGRNCWLWRGTPIIGHVACCVFRWACKMTSNYLRVLATPF